VLRWSRSTVENKCHHPQHIDRPACTVCREWSRRSKESFVLDVENSGIRPLHWREVARLQGFDADWFNVDGLNNRQKMEVIGNAVPPPMAAVVFDQVIASKKKWLNQTVVELCAGVGGLAPRGIHADPKQTDTQPTDFKVTALFDYDEACCTLLRHHFWRGPRRH
jgi:site-specific DNA-cytosine methylase